jgi:outer membrane receptor protein involved in Fe transport
VQRIELRGVQVIGDCADGTPGCPRTDERSTEARAETELGHPAGPNNFLRATVGGGVEWLAGAPTGSHRRASGSAALLDDIQLGERASLHPAARLDVVGNTIGISPGIAATFRPVRNGALSQLQLRAGAGASFRPPTLSELYLDRGGVDPNPDLVAERAWSVDAGASYHAGPLTFSVGVFASRYDDLIKYELTPPFRIKPRNVGLARVAGLESQLALLLPSGFVAEVSYSYLDAVNLRKGERGGNLLAYRPPHRIFGRLARQGDRIEGYAQANYTSSMPRNEFETAFLPAQLVLDAGAGMRVAGPLWVDLEVRNLLDDRTHEDLFHNPLPGLTLAALARARF